MGKTLIFKLVVAAVAAVVLTGLMITGNTTPKENNRMDESPIVSNIAADFSFDSSATKFGKEKSLELDDANATTPVYLTNGIIVVTIDPETGHIIRIIDMSKTNWVGLLDGRMDDNTLMQPFTLKMLDSPDAETCTPQYPPMFEECDDNGIPCRKITWQCDENVSVQATVSIPDERPAVQFQASAYTNGANRIFSLTYPILGSIQQLSADANNDTLAVPYEGGLLISNPLERIREENSSTIQILSNLKYPQGHSMMLQMIGYQSKGIGGFLAYTKDPNYSVKQFHFRSLTPTQTNPTVVLSFEHLNWDVDDVDGRGGMEMDYPVEIVATQTGDWHESADLYRQWAEEQQWSNEPIAEREPEDRKLFETAAFSVFGISAREDQTAWYRAFNDDIIGNIPDARVLFVPAWDFHPNGEKADSLTHGFYQAGWDEQYWLPYQGAFVDNYKVMKNEHDDFVYPFLFDLLVHDNYPGWSGWDQPDASGFAWKDFETLGPNGQPNGVVESYPGIEGNARTLSPANATMKEFYRWRHELITHTTQDGINLDMDGTYHDISASIFGLENYRSDPSTPYRGAGRFMIEAVRDNHSALIGDRARRNTSFGMENCSEPFIDQIDFYHLGSQGLGPMRTPVAGSGANEALFEGVHNWIMAGLAQEIPLFSFVYHPYGAMRTGGKVQISYEIGDVFYWIAANEYLWGGILELIYYNTWIDLLPGVQEDQANCPDGEFPCSFQTGWSDGSLGNRGWHFGEEVREADPEKIEFLRKAAYLRTVAAKDYLTKGRMLTPPNFKNPQEPINYEYNFYSHIRGPEYYHHGFFPAAPALVEAWETWDSGKIAFILSNPSDQPRSITLEFDPAQYGLDRTIMRLVNVQPKPHAQPPLGVCEAGAPCSVTIKMNARSFAMIELN